MNDEYKQELKRELRQKLDAILRDFASKHGGSSGLAFVIIESLEEISADWEDVASAWYKDK